MTSFNETLDSLKTHPVIAPYFVNNEIDVEQFILNYIPINDYILSQQSHDVSTMTNKLDCVQLKIDSLKHTIEQLSNETVKNDLLKLFNESFSTLVSQLSSQSSSLDQVQSLVSKDLENMKLYINSALHQSEKSTDKLVFEQMSQILKELSFSDKLNSIHEIVSSLHTNLTSHSTNKGAISENILFNKLTSEFPDAEILESRNTPHSGDFIIKRQNKPTFLIDIKNYSRNVPTEELEKFHRDMKFQQCHGVLASVSTGIACKQHFDIDLIDNKLIALYVHNFNYDPFFIRLASNVIDHLASVLSTHYDLNNVVIPRETFASLKSEYETFLSVFHNHLQIIKNNLTALANLQLGLLDQFFSSTVSRENNPNSHITPYYCSICRRYYKSNWTLKRHLLTKHPELVEDDSNQDHDNAHDSHDDDSNDSDNTHAHNFGNHPDLLENLLEMDAEHPDDYIDLRQVLEPTRALM